MVQNKRGKKKRILPRAIYNYSGERHRLTFSSSQRVAKMDQLSLFDSAGPYFFRVWWWKGNSLHSIGSRFNSLKAYLWKMCDCYFCKGIDRNCMGSIKVTANDRKVLINKCSYDFRSLSASPCNGKKYAPKFGKHFFQSHRSSEKKYKKVSANRWKKKTFDPWRRKPSKISNYWNISSFGSPGDSYYSFFFFENRVMER